MKNYDIIIMGAGIIGSASAYWASKYTSKVLVLEQFDFFHKKGSSHGASRIIRKAYSEPYFAKMAICAYQLWEKIEKESNFGLITTTGGLDLGNKDDITIKKIITTLKETGQKYQIFSANQMKRDFSQLLVPENYISIFQEDAGIINAKKAIQAFQKLAKIQGAEFVDNTKLLSVTNNSDRLTITTNADEYSCDKLLLTAGAWTKQFLEQQFQLKINYNVYEPIYTYFKTENKSFSSEKFPIFIFWGDNKYYGLPEHEKLGYIKLGVHESSKFRNTNPDYRDKKLLKVLHKELLLFAKKHFNGLSMQSEKVEPCLYSTTQDENFIIDKLPNDEKIILGAGFSGHGFKFAPLIGKLLVQLAMDEPPSVNLSRFNIRNFLD